MSKTIDLQVAKSLQLIKGYNKHLSELQKKGVEKSKLEQMEKDLAELKKCSDECDAARQAVALKVKDVNARLNACKEDYLEQKKIVKESYLQEEWAKFGIPDKR